MLIVDEWEYMPRTYLVLMNYHGSGYGEDRRFFEFRFQISGRHMDRTKGAIINYKL